MSVVSLVLYLLFKFEEKRVFFKKKNKLNNYPLTTFVLYFTGKMKYISLSKQTNKQTKNSGIMKNSLIKEKQMSLILLY